MADTTGQEKQSVENYINSLLNQENKESIKEYSLPKNYLNSLSKNNEITDEEVKSLLDDTSSVDSYVKKVEDSSINFNNDIQSYSESVQNYIQSLKEKSSNKDRQNKLDKIGGALQFLAEKRELLKKGPIQNKKVEQYIQEVQDYKFSIADYDKNIQQYTEMLSGKSNALSIFDPEIPIESNEPTEEEKFEEEINEEITADKKEKIEGSITEIVEKDEEEQKVKKEEIIKDSKEQVKDYVSKISDAQKKIKEEQKFLDPESVNKTDHEKKLENKIEKLDKKLNSLTNQIGALKSGGSNWGDILKINESFIPSQNNYYDIGAPGKRWRDIYLSGSTIYLEGITLSKRANSNSLAIAPVVENEDGSISIIEEEQVNFATEDYVTTAISTKANTSLLTAKANSADLALVATTGSYNDLTGKPTIPTLVSELTNDSGYITAAQVQASTDANNSTYFNGQNSAYYLNYNNHTNTPTIPTKISDLTNDLLFVNSSSLNVPSSISDLTNDLLFVNTSDLSTVATTGSYGDLSGTPTIPTSVSDLTNDLLFVNTSDLSTVATSGSYNDLSGTPTIPTSVSDLTNDLLFINSTSLSNYATTTYVDNEITNLVGNAPEALNTLQELSIALSNDANFAASITTSLSAKANSSDLSTVATSGSYNDLSGTPTIPSSVSDLTNDLLFINSTSAAIPSSVSDLTNDLLFVNTSDLSTVATSGSYGDLSGTPTIPSSISDLTNDLLFVNTSDLSTVATTGSYGDLSGTPTIPTSVSDLTNDLLFINSTSAAIPSSVSDLTNDLLFVNTSDLSTVATSGSYGDLSGTPTIPSSITDLNISDGTNGQVLTTNGSGGFTFQTISDDSFINAIIFG